MLQKTSAKINKKTKKKKQRRDPELPVNDIEVIG